MMNSNENQFSLSLSDIMHPMSPSPAPGEDLLPTPIGEHQPRYDPDALAEPLSNSDAIVIRNRLQELGLVMYYQGENEESAVPRLAVANHLTVRERELTDMILRLTSCPRIDSAQLEEQATTISTLATQRDYLIAEAEEERLKLHSERENWNRTAEALLTQKTRPLKTEDMDTQRAAYEAEIKSLREKLHDRHRRLSAVEQEILRLKPLLLLQPYSNQSKQTMGTQNQTARGKRPDIDASPSKVGPTQKSDHTAFPYGYQYRPEVSLSSGQSFASHTFLLEGPSTSGPSSQQRRSRDHSNTQKVKKQKHYRSTTSDAYAEHVLLAAQRIGRKRAAVVTGRQRLADREQEIFARENDQVTPRKELERLEKDKLASGTSNMTYYRPSEDSGPSSTPNGPKVPKRSGLLYGQRHNANPGGVNTPPPPAYVFVNTSAARMSNSSAYSPGSILKTPSRPDTTIRLSQASNPPTPLDSLVDAARMMGEGGYRTRRRLLEEPESPTAKRRKVSGDKVLVNRGTSRLGHVKSGLDVLADQAAAVIKPQSSAVHLGNDSRTASDGKGKGKATSQTTDTMTTRNSPTKSRGSTRTARPPSRRLFTSHDELPSASSPSVDRGTITPEPRLIALPTAVSSGFVARVGVNLRPVSAWGDPPTPDEDEEDSNSDSMCQSPTQSVLRNETPRVAFSDPNALEENNALVSAVQPASVPLGATHDISDAALNGCDEERDSLERKYTHHIDDSKDATPQASTQSSIQQTLATGRLEVSRSQLVEHPACQPPPQAPTRQASPRGSTECSDDAAGSVFDEDAEGEEDEENTENDADVASRDHPFRSRSPPPPDPPGSDNGPGPSNEQDPDADADGDVDVDGKGTPPPSGTDFATNRNGHHRQTAAFVTETSSTKASYTMPLFFFSLTAMSTHSTGMQRSRLSIHTIVCNVNNRAFPQAIQFIEGWNVMIRDTLTYIPVSKSASVVSH